MTRIFLVMLISCLFQSPANAQGFLKARGKYIVDGRNQPVLLRGMGLGGWMLQEPYMLDMVGLADAQHAIGARIEKAAGAEARKRFYQSWLANHCTRGDIDSLAAWGFNSVRLPMHYNLFTLPTEQEPVAGHQTWVQTGFQLTDSLLQWCKDARIYLILDLHAAPGGQGNDLPISDRDKTKPSLWQSEANRHKTIALWRKLAERYAGEEWIGGYDLINETNWGFQDSTDRNGCNEKENKALRQLLSDITHTIREVDRNHLIFIEGNCWANNYNGMFPLWDDNMAVSFHKYWNFNDDDAVAKFVQIREEQNVPIWMGESGENSNAWYTDAIALMERHQIGWAWWPMKKLGGNNPLQVKAPGFEKLLAYWKGEGPQPSQEEAARILQEFAAATHLSRNVVHRDVVDAMIRQVTSVETLPFRSRLLRDTLTLFAPDFDLGRSGRAYHDRDSANYWVSNQQRTAWNQGYAYRNDGVDIRPAAGGATNGYAVAWTEPGEWMQYSFDVGQPGWFVLTVRSASDSAGALSLRLNGGNWQSLSLKPGSSWQSSRLSQAVWMEKGRNRLVVRVDQGGFSLASLHLSRKPASAGRSQNKTFTTGSTTGKK